MPDKNPESTIGVGGRAMFWEGVFSNTSSVKPEAPSSEKSEQNAAEESSGHYDHAEVRPVKPKE